MQNTRFSQQRQRSYSTVAVVALPAEQNPQNTRKLLTGVTATCATIALASAIILHNSSYPHYQIIEQTQQNITTTNIQQHSSLNKQISVTQKTTNTSAQLTRLPQMDPNQYQSLSQYNTWAASACSAASMTEIINSYSHQYTIGDIIAVESRIGEITPESGMLDGFTSVQRTVSYFGFQAQDMENLPLDTLINTANSGKPIMIGFPPGTWSTGGHLLVLRGGNSQQVYIADSSTANMTELSRTTFLSYFRGFAVLITPSQQ